jgi:molybdopterin-guanine dinucleotide biosynthesis protein A
VEAARAVVDANIELPRVPPPMHEIVAQFGPRVIKFEEYAHLDGAGEFFSNINTVEDLERARTRR